MTGGHQAPEGAPGLAVTSVILGVLGFCTGGLLALVGLVLGITAAVGVHRRRDAGGPGRGGGTAVAGIVVSSVGLLVGPVVALVSAAIAIPALAVAREEAANAAARVSLAKIGAAAAVYAEQHADAFPPPGDWVAALRPYARDVDADVVWALEPEAGRAFAMNRSLEGRTYGTVAAPSDTVLLFETRPGAPLAGGPEMLPDEPRVLEGYLVLFVDGAVENVRREHLPTLIWE